jgi:hypothetical protein
LLFLDLVDLVFFIFFRGWVGQFHLLYKINGNLMMNGVGTYDDRSQILGIVRIRVW